MAGRPSKPTQLIALEGRSHRTKAEMKHREHAEKSLYTGTTFKESTAVKSDPVAHREFTRLKKLYKSIQYVDGLDEQTINRYCILISQEDGLIKAIHHLNEKVGECETIEEQIQVYQVINSTSTKLEKVRDMLIKLEDRLFLNPTSRIKSIPKQPPEEKKESKMAQFMNRRAGHGT